MTDWNEKLIEAAGRGKLRSVKKCLKNGADIHAKTDLALRFAAWNGHLPIVKFLVENGADIHAGGDNALCYAAVYGHLPVVKFLVEKGADIHAEDDWALRAATKNRHTEVVEYLEEQMQKSPAEPLFSDDVFKRYNAPNISNISPIDHINLECKVITYEKCISVEQRRERLRENIKEDVLAAIRQLECQIELFKEQISTIKKELLNG